MSQFAEKARSVIVRLSGIGTLLLLWELIARVGLVDPVLFPPPTAVTASLMQLTLSGQLPMDVFASTVRALAGFTLGAIAGIAAGALTGRAAMTDAVVSPVIQVLRPVPVIALVPLAIVWFGLGEMSKIFLIFWGVFFPVWVGTHLGVSRIDRTYFWAARSAGASQTQLWTKLILPASLPNIIASLRTAISLAFIVLVAAEMAGSFLGVGYRISAYHLVFEVDKMMAYIVVLGLMGYLADRGFALIIDRMFPWYRLAVHRD